MSAPTPSRVRLRAYKVGFGDCLLLTITYSGALPDGRRQRHMLIDCGTMRAADGGPSISDVAELISDHCTDAESGEGKLDVVVATHRHKDHISGFGNAAAGKTLDALNPSVVIRPWTDVPEAQRGKNGLKLDDAHQRFLASLDALPQWAVALEELAFDNATIAKRAKELAELGLSNTKAIALLEEWGSNGRAEYVHAGTTIDLADVLPGVDVQVLGPPTLDQAPGLSRYAKESEDYWFALAAEGIVESQRVPAAAGSVARASGVLASPGGMGSAEWLVRQLNSRRATQGLEIIEALDNALNNTSVVLLVTVGNRRLLLPGDAQLENWSYSLDQSLAEGKQSAAGKALARELAKVDLYKVGHHGSRNATPKKLLRHWTKSDGSKRRIVSVLTTQRGVYGIKGPEGAVPKDTLTAGLSEYGPVHSTDDLPADVWWLDVEASARGTKGFEIADLTPHS